MESATIAAQGTPGGAKEGDKGLKAGAIGYLSNLVIGVASTAPGYSLAATLGFIVAVQGMGFHAPAVLLVSFIPMLLIAAAYYGSIVIVFGYAPGGYGGGEVRAQREAVEELGEQVTAKGVERAKTPVLVVPV
ncbi:MAG TPA: hypothetical protein VFN72_08380 [Solirubrobacterales bacterium]|nr:hypothetical protein [Solirubrobacterales bacterium]